MEAIISEVFRLGLKGGGRKPVSWATIFGIIMSNIRSRLTHCNWFPYLNFTEPDLLNKNLPILFSKNSFSPIPE